MFAARPSSRRTGDWVCEGCRFVLQQRRVARQRRGYAAAVATSSVRKISQKLPDTPARTRFAPSPTGYLHLGSLRTALFNYLLARATKGHFLLRIEDTDQKRTVPGALERICRDLEWAGLTWDEGPEVGGPYGPYQQSQRPQLYREHAKKLLESGHAYRCFCTAERLQGLAAARAKMGLPTDYDRACAEISKEESDDRASKGESHTVRLRVPSIYPEYVDLVYGRVGKAQRAGSTRKHGETVYEDPILMKSDGLPTYHLANVVDDHLMKITHVVRAAEWMPSTPKHLALYEAFGWQAPAFAHVGLLQDAKGQKLSKRNADIDLVSYRKQGIFPEALLNFCALLGWSHTRGDDFMRLKELVEIFDLKFTKGNTLVNFKKLNYLQRQHAQKYIDEQGPMFEKIVDEILTYIEQNSESLASTVPVGRYERKYVAALLKADAKKYTSPKQFFEANRSFFVEKIARLDLVDELNDNIVDMFQNELEKIPEEHWNKSSISAALNGSVGNFSGTDEMLTEANSHSKSGRWADLLSKINRYLRWAILSSPGPPMAESMEILGRDTCLARLKDARSAQHQTTV